MSRRRMQYFERVPEAPTPLSYAHSRRVAFSEVDVMAIAWHGRYAVFFEESSTELRRRCGFSYEELRDARLRAPILQLHVDYYRPVLLDELITIRASLLWNEAARLDTEYSVRREDGSLAATGYTVQLFTDAETTEPYMASPGLLDRCRQRWLAGEFKSLQ